ncbi:KH domain-containing protein akap-1 [Ischnura elegans]|uniref:KH domain-containing protein akap-1 n=1 Tax=Ischnura elegans TaxID=197161 RepID=UPI001ED8B1A1|nr:KH domain-containing protein akap-1 [Ischnura elegans]XP_046390956.1 KH domain-containing protein akap-1 [Ischnura elegans]XP_046390957.1 KH domain-containing protein akap-1 [Ischnura elegans]
MPFGIPSLRGVLKWPPTPTLIIAASGLVIAVVAVTHRIWRGGGKKAIDPDGKKLDSKTKGKEYSGSRFSFYYEHRAPTPVQRKGSACVVTKEKEDTVKADTQIVGVPKKKQDRPNGTIPFEKILKVEEIALKTVIPENLTGENTADVFVRKPDIVCDRPNGSVPLENLKADGIEQKVITERQTVLDVISDAKADTSVEKQKSNFEASIETDETKRAEVHEPQSSPEVSKETVRSEDQFPLLPENPSHLAFVKEAELGSTTVEKPDSPKLMTLVQSVVPGSKGVEIISVEELIVPAKALPSQCGQVAIDKTKETSVSKPVGRGDFQVDVIQENEVSEISNEKDDSDVEKLNHTLCGDSGSSFEVTQIDCDSSCEIVEGTVKVGYLKDAGSKASVKTQCSESVVDSSVQLTEPTSDTLPVTEDSCSLSFQNTLSSENSHIENIPYTSLSSETIVNHPKEIHSNFLQTKESIVLSGVTKEKEVLESTKAGEISEDCCKEPNQEFNNQEAVVVSSIEKDVKEVHKEVSNKESSASEDEKQEVVVETNSDCAAKMKSEEVELLSSAGLGGLKDNEVKLIPLERKSKIMEESVMSPKGKSGKRKGKKQKKILKEEEVINKLDSMERKTIVELKDESLETGHSVEDNNGKSSQRHASGINSPSLPNFPDNRSEGSSCGDSGKGRSDVTTPGGLEEELREGSFSNHFSPPCSTSGPEEEDEDRVRRASGSTAEDGSHEELGSAIGGEDIVANSPVPLGSDELVMPVALPVYPGMVPITPPPSVYEFVIPQGLVGRLIGKHGSFVNLIKARTSATIFIKTHPETNKLKVCAIEGTEDEIQAALEMIREKFPLRRYSSMTLEQVFFLPLPPPTFTLIPDSLPLQLVEGVSNDVILSALVSPSHYFLQQPTHPTYPTLAKQDMWMAMSYQDANAPMLPEDIKAGIICAAPTMGGWYRAQIVNVEELPSVAEDESTEEGELVKWCDVRFVDYGGYERLPAHFLRQIRSDFMTLPFQASECYLASVVPAASNKNEVADVWSDAAYALVEELTQAQVLKAQVVGHSPDGLPLVLLYAYSQTLGQVVQVNEELVNHGLALWAMPVIEPDQVFVNNGTDNVSGEENPDETETEAISA